MTPTLALSHVVTTRPGPQASPRTRELLGLGRARGWDFQVLGRAPLPVEPVRVGKWLLVPAQDDTSRIPARALARVQAIYEAGLTPAGFVLVHEAPLELAAPAGARPARRFPELSPAACEALAGAGRAVAEAAPGVLLGLAKAVAVAVAAGAAVIVGGPLALLFGLAMLDPILVAVTADGYWVEVDRWNV
jgi:hypothetical protein